VDLFAVAAKNGSVVRRVEAERREHTRGDRIRRLTEAIVIRQFTKPPPGKVAVDRWISPRTDIENPNGLAETRQPGGTGKRAAVSGNEKKAVDQ
jgi:hypothetical protein